MNNKMVGLYPNIMVILLDVNGLNTQIKRQTLSEKVLQSKRQLYAIHKILTLNKKDAAG